jgi:hypothetical protein
VEEIQQAREMNNEVVFKEFNFIGYAYNHSYDFQTSCS